MKPRDPEPDTRLAVACLVTFVWLAWVLLVPGALPPVVVHPARPPAPLTPAITALFCAAVLLKLCPLAVRGKTAIRVAALGACLLPALVLAWIVTWLVHPG